MDNLAAARACAARHGYAETFFSEPSRVVSFAARGARLNYYYTTRTVGTCLEHPTQGRTQLFRRGVSHELLDALFANPRAHTDRGYHRAGGDAGRPPAAPPGGGASASPPAPAPAPALPASAEEDALAAHIAELEAELAPLRAWHGELRAARLAAAAAEQERLRREAAERARAAAAAAAELAREAAEAEAEREREAAAAAQRERERVRGTAATYSLREPTTSFISGSGYATDRSIALGCAAGEGVAVRLREDGTWALSAGLPRLLLNVFSGRAPHHPKPQYVQMSCSRHSDPSWLVLLDNGGCKWSVTPEFAEDYNAAVGQGRRLKFCAFGAPGCHYLHFTDDSAKWRGLSARHDAKLFADSLSFVALGPQNQMFVRYCGGRCGWVEGPKDAMDEVSALLGRGHDVRQVHFGGEQGDEYIVRYS